MADRYQMIDVVGSGGMATVWRARDRELGRMVAIKRPHPSPSGSTTYERFRREARSAAAVSHPNLVTVYDAGIDDEGPYIVMELVDAPSLAHSQVDPGNSAAIGASLAGALAALHAVDIVHRDIKPANILLAPGGPQLTDFGIARSLDATDDVTQAGVNFGTPSYAPPETLAGGVHDEAGDVYSLAVVIHEMFTGERLQGEGGTRVMVTDRFLRPVLEPALAMDPTERPTAAAFAASLAAIPSDALGVDSTQTFPSTPGDDSEAGATGAGGIDMIGAPRSSTVSSELKQRWQSTDRSSRLLGVFLTGCALLAMLLLVVGLTRADRDDDVVGAPPASEAAPEPAADDDAAEPALGQDGVAPPPLPQPDPALTAIATARDAFDGYVASLDEGVLEEKDAKKVLDEVAQAIDSAAEGDLDEAEKRFGNAAKRLGDKVSGDAAVGESLALLGDLAAAVGVQLDLDT